MTYDGNGNFLSAQRNGYSGALMDGLTYNYYANSNKLDHVVDAVPDNSFQTDLDNQPPQNYCYDGNGNMQTDTKNLVGFVIYDINNLPLRIFKTTGTILDYMYDAANQRVRKFDSFGGNTYYYNGADGKTEVIQYGTSNTLTYNLYGLEMFGRIQRDGLSASRYYYLKDHLGTIRMTLNETGGISSSADFYPFGMEMDVRSLNNGLTDNRYKFTGKERDVETNYDYFGARYYDARIGRWLSRDPLAEKYPSLSPYVYCADNPMKFVDPNGKWLAYTHNRLIADAFRGMKDVNVGNLQKASAWADQDAFQGPASSYRHGMLTGDDMQDNFNVGLMNAFISEDNVEIDAKREEIDEFGVKLHTIMDLTSPSHEGLQRWGTKDGENPNIFDQVGHVLREVFISTRRYYATLRLMREYKKDYESKEKKVKTIYEYQAIFDQYMQEESEEEREYYSNLGTQ